MVKIFVRQFPLVGAYLAMKPILAVFWNICLLRRGPELVPTHPLFVGGVIVLNVLAGFLVGIQATEATAVQVATSTFVSMATLAALTWIALTVRGVVGRFPATITAMFGCDLLFTLLIALLVPHRRDCEPHHRVDLGAHYHLVHRRVRIHPASRDECDGVRWYRAFVRYGLPHHRSSGRRVESLAAKGLP